MRLRCAGMAQPISKRSRADEQVCGSERPILPGWVSFGTLLKAVSFFYHFLFALSLSHPQAILSSFLTYQRRRSGDKGQQH